MLRRELRRYEMNSRKEPTSNHMIANLLYKMHIHIQGIPTNN
jgi:hypothetical protein